ncbi:MAG: hypothetical protein RI884_2230 [Pseudomonadota bacterium]|jgi:hypothetical protein
MNLDFSNLAWNIEPNFTFNPQTWSFPSSVVTDQPPPPSSPPVGKQTALPANVLVMIHNFYLLQIQNNRDRVEASTQRLTKIRDLLRSVNDALTELTTLQISVPEKGTQKEFDAYAKKNATQMQRLDNALTGYQSTVIGVLNPAPGTPGTVTTARPGGGTVTTYIKPFAGVRMPDLAFLRPTTATTNSIARLDATRHSGVDIAKTIKTLQTDVTSLNQTFQLESSDGSSALSTHNAIQEGAKSFLDKYFAMISRAGSDRNG